LIQSADPIPVSFLKSFKVKNYCLKTPEERRKKIYKDFRKKRRSSKTHKQKYTVERKWRKFKYSVNSETSLRENENKANNNVKNEHLATHNNKGENKKNANTRISVLQHRYKRSTEPQLTATKTDYNNSKVRALFLLIVNSQLIANMEVLEIQTHLRS